ncbi:MAG: hypothetical protein AAF598_17555 [Bacteroidota bacterium]
MKVLKYILAGILLFLGLMATAQTPMKQKIEMNINQEGSAELKISQKMDAQQWQNWIATTGSNPALLKRQIEKDMPAFFLDDFKLEKNEMDRSFELSLKAYGVCKVDKRGDWILETDAKEVDLTELGERKYMYVHSPIEYGGQLQQTTIIQFPEKAEGIEVDTDAFGKTIFEFDMQEEKAGFGIPGYGGIALLVIGLILMVVNAVRR